MERNSSQMSQYFPPVYEPLNKDLVEISEKNHSIATAGEGWSQTEPVPSTSLLVFQHFAFTLKNMTLHQLYISFLMLLITEYHKLDGLKKQKGIVSEFWRQDIRNQSTGKAMLPVKPGGKSFLPLPSFQCLTNNPWHFLAYIRLTPISASIVTWHFLWVSVLLRIIVVVD